MATIEYAETMELLRKNIEILRKLGALTKKELDNLKPNLKLTLADFLIPSLPNKEQ